MSHRPDEAGDSNSTKSLACHGGAFSVMRPKFHGARAVLIRVKYDTAGLGQWIHKLAERAPRNKVIVAIANKLARIAWAVFAKCEPYRHQPLAAAA